MEVVCADAGWGVIDLPPKRASSLDGLASATTHLPRYCSFTPVSPFASQRHEDAGAAPDTAGEADVRPRFLPGTATSRVSAERAHYLSCLLWEGDCGLEKKKREQREPLKLDGGPSCFPETRARGIPTTSCRPSEVAYVLHLSSVAHCSRNRVRGKARLSLRYSLRPQSCRGGQLLRALRSPHRDQHGGPRPRLCCRGRPRPGYAR